MYLPYSSSSMAFLLWSLKVSPEEAPLPRVNFRHPLFGRVIPDENVPGLWVDQPRFEVQRLEFEIPVHRLFVVGVHNLDFLKL